MVKKIKVLIAGESWVAVVTHIKGLDYMTSSTYEEAVEWLQRALEKSDIQVDYLPSHLAPTKFPDSMAELKQYDTIILSDIGANSLLLHPDTYIHSKTTPNRLDALHDYVHEGGSLMMVGGYLTFTGLNGKANYKGTSVEKALPVALLPVDDRIEMPQGFSPGITDPNHPVMRNIRGPWPTLLGYNRTEAKQGATLLLQHNNDPIAAVWEYGSGRTGVFTSDCAPHWGTPEFLAWPHYTTFFSQMVRWLAKTI